LGARYIWAISVAACFGIGIGVTRDFNNPPAHHCHNFDNTRLFIRNGYSKGALDSSDNFLIETFNIEVA